MKLVQIIKFFPLVFQGLLFHLHPHSHLCGLDKLAPLMVILATNRSFGKVPFYIIWLSTSLTAIFSCTVELLSNCSYLDSWRRRISLNLYKFYVCFP